MPAKKNHELPTVGKTFTREYKGSKYTMKVVKTSGRIGYKVKDKIYGSPSTAGKSITHIDVNGWVFWKIEE
jgi:hypothetical protein